MEVSVTVKAEPNNYVTVQTDSINHTTKVRLRIDEGDIVMVDPVELINAVSRCIRVGVPETTE